MNCPVEDRLALQDLTIAYCSAADAIGDVAGVMELFTHDAVYDLDSLGMGQCVGVQAIGDFFATAFATMAHNAHYASNFAVIGHSGDNASVTAYIHAYSLGKGGAMLEVRARYTMACVRTGSGWKIARLGLVMLIPG